MRKAKRLVAFLITVVMVLGAMLVSSPVFAETDYTGYYKITNAGQLSWFACLVVGDTSQSSITAAEPNAKAVLTADIDITVLAERFGKTWSGIGTEEIPFTGIFDGNGYTIKGLTIDTSLTTPTVATISVDTEKQGLFGVIGEGGVVRNVILEGTASVSDTQKLGAVCSENNGTIENVLSKMTVEGPEGTDAFCHTNNGTITNCYTDQEGAQAATLVTASQLEDGSVAYSLGDAFGQTIGEDTQPVHFDGTNRVYKYDTEYSNLSKLTLTSANIKVENLCQEAVLVVTTFNSDDELIDVDVVAVSADTTKTLEEIGVNTTNAEYHKAMLIKSMPSLTPLADSVRANSENVIELPKVEF